MVTEALKKGFRPHRHRVFFDCLRGRKPSAMGAAVGCVVGLVAITPSAGYVTVGQSIFISFVITLICNTAVYFNRLRVVSLSAEGVIIM